MECPAEIVAETAKEQSYAYVNWTIPEVTDNADASPILWTKPHVVLPWKAKIGTRVVVYVAQDASGNKARCKFKVKVLGKAAEVFRPRWYLRSKRMIFDKRSAD